MGLSDTRGSGDPSDRRPRRMQGDRLVAEVDTGLRVGSKGRFKGLGEPRLELTDRLEAGAELRVDRRPRNRGGSW